MISYLFSPFSFHLCGIGGIEHGTLTLTANTTAMAISFPLPVRREGLALLASRGMKVEPLSTTANKRGLLKLILIPLVLQLGGRVSV